MLCRTTVVLRHSNRDESKKIVFGEDPFDRYAVVDTDCVIFFDDVKIEDFLYSSIDGYDQCAVFYVGMFEDLRKAMENLPDDLSSEVTIMNIHEGSNIDKYEYHIGYNNNYICSIVRADWREIPQEVLNAIIDSLTIGD